MADIVIVPNTDNPVQVNVSQQTQTISVSVPDINVVDVSAGLTITIEGNGGGSSTFLGLTDTPSSYIDQGDRFLAVNTNGTAVTFVDAPTGDGTVTSVNTIEPVDGNVTLSTTNVPEGDNLYYTDALVSQNSTVVQNSTDIASEETARIAADTALQSQITSNDTDIATLTSDLSAEVTNRTGADTTLQNNISAEASARAAADTQLQNNIDAEVANRQAADTNLNTSIIANTNSINAIKDRVFYSDAGGDDKVTVKPADSTVKIDIDGTGDVIEFTAANVKSTTISSTGVSTKGLTIDNGSNPFTLPTADGSSNQVLTTDGSGNVTWDTKAFPNVSIAGLAAAGDHDINADKWFFGTGVTSAGRLIYLSSTGAWGGADASAASTAKGMISVAVGTNPSTDGVVIRGFVYLTVDAGGNVGDPVYLSETGGAVTTTAPTTSGAVVRVMGYKVATNIIYFNPSQDWIEIA